LDGLRGETTIEQINKYRTPSGFFFAWCLVFADNLSVSLRVNAPHGQHTITFYMTIFSFAS
jgi:hypothetical protein